MVVSYSNTTNEVSMANSSKVITLKQIQTNREICSQTDMQTCVKPLPTCSRGCFSLLYNKPAVEV